MTDAAGISALSTLWQERGIDVALLRTRADGSLMASELRLGTSETLAADGPALSGAELVLSTEQLKVGALLGRGGMGEVRVAEQGSLRR